jgi:hypothetical protein
MHNNKLEARCTHTRAISHVVVVVDEIASNYYKNVNLG